MAIEFEHKVDSRKMGFSAGTCRLVGGVQRSYIPVRYMTEEALYRLYTSSIEGEIFMPTERIVGIVKEEGKKAISRFWLGNGI